MLDVQNLLFMECTIFNFMIGRYTCWNICHFFTRSFFVCWALSPYMISFVNSYKYLLPNWLCEFVKLVIMWGMFSSCCIQSPPQMGLLCVLIRNYVRHVDVSIFLIFKTIIPKEILLSVGNFFTVSFTWRIFIYFCIPTQRGLWFYF